MDRQNRMKTPSKTNGKGSNFAISREVGGRHYNKLKIQPIEFITANNLDFIDGNIVKYAVRQKQGESDHERYDKIIHYCELAKELKKENPKQESWVDGYKKWKKNNVV